LRVLVNIRGANGSGKSTIPMTMLQDEPHVRIEKDSNGTKYTIFPSYRWVALGTYLNKTGGMDTISTKAEKQALLEYLWYKYPDYDIVMEGVIDSTIRSTYIELFNTYQLRVKAKEINPRKIIVVNFLPPLEVCIKRVYERNGGKPIKEDQIKSKWGSVYRNIPFFREAGITSLKVDTSKIPKEEMLPRFLKIVDKYREEE
jgi:hypothetical protein